MQKVLDTDFQQIFLDKLKNSLPPSLSLVNEISDKLQISMDSAYRRIRNETSMSVDEAVVLCKAYKLSLDGLVNQANAVTFNYPRLDSLHKYFRYFSDFYQNLGLVTACKGNLVFAADDIPVFHTFLFKELAAFKLFYFFKSNFQITEFQDKKFSVESIPKDLLDLCMDCYKRYLEVNSIEIWNERTVDGTISQIEYFYDTGNYEHKQEVLLVAEQLLETIKTVEKQTAQKSKGGGDEFCLYQVELMIGNSCVLVNLGERKICYLRHQTINSMVTQHHGFNAETEVFLNNLISKSVLLSGVGEKQRHQFFLKIYKKIEALIEKVKE